MPQRSCRQARDGPRSWVGPPDRVERFRELRVHLQFRPAFPEEIRRKQVRKITPAATIADVDAVNVWLNSPGPGSIASVNSVAHTCSIFP